MGTVLLSTRVIDKSTHRENNVIRLSKLRNRLKYSRTLFYCILICFIKLFQDYQLVFFWIHIIRDDSHRGINVDHGISVDQHSKPQVQILYTVFALVSWF
jgi:hypothetical protein